jgi:hypothetical protein
MLARRNRGTGWAGFGGLAALAGRERLWRFRRIALGCKQRAESENKGKTDGRQWRSIRLRPLRPGVYSLLLHGQS